MSPVIPMPTIARTASAVIGASKASFQTSLTYSLLTPPPIHRPKRVEVKESRETLGKSSLCCLYLDAATESHKRPAFWVPNCGAAGKNLLWMV